MKIRNIEESEKWMKAIEIRNLTKKYGKKEILKSISLEIEEGECLGIMGESGSGKSTLAKLISGLEKINEGEIKILGLDRNSNHREDLQKLSSSVEMLFQNSYQALNPNMSVEDLIFENLQFLKINKSKREIVLSLMKEVELNENLIDRRSSELSGGQIQRVCLARAISTHPRIMIFDEALSGLDPLIQIKILDLLLRLQREFSLTYIFISHDFELCYYLADRIILMDGGKILEEFKDLDNIEPQTEKAKLILNKFLKEVSK